jgi:hypothetical protein
MTPTIALTYDTFNGKVLFKLSDSSSNFSLNSVSVTGGTLQFFGGVNDNYAAYFSPFANSTVGNAIIKVASGAFSDAAGNANADGDDENNTITIPVPPTIAINYNTSTSRVDFKLSGYSPNFSINSIVVTGGTLQYFGGFNDTYGGYFVPAANRTAGNAFIKVASGAFTDSAGNANADGADENNTITIPIPPTIALTYDPSTSRVDFKLSGASPNFSIKSITVSGGTLQYFGGANDTFAAMFIPDDKSQMNGSIQVANGAFTDASGNANTDGADSDNTVIIAKTTNTSAGATNTGSTPSAPTNGSMDSANTNNKVDTVKKDALPGTSGNDVINAGDGNDLITASPGNDTMDGGAGVDTISYAGTYADFSVSEGENGALKLTSSKFGSDNIINVERFKFSDVHFANDLSGSAGNAAKVITAAFGQEYVPQFLAIGITLADSGQGIEALCATVTRDNLVESIAGDSSTNGYVSALFKNVVGRAPNIFELKAYAGMLETGAISRLGLLEFAANHSMVSDAVDSLKVELLGIAYEPGF